MDYVPHLLRPLGLHHHVKPALLRKPLPGLGLALGFQQPLPLLLFFFEGPLKALVVLDSLELCFLVQEALVKAALKLSRLHGLFRLLLLLAVLQHHFFHLPDFILRDHLLAQACHLVSSHEVHHLWLRLPGIFAPVSNTDMTAWDALDRT